MSLLKDFPILQRNISNIRLNSSCHFTTYCASLEGHKKEALRSGPALNENCFPQHQISRLMQEESSAGSAQQRAMGYINSELLHSPWKMAKLVTACSLRASTVCHSPSYMRYCLTQGKKEGTKSRTEQEKCNQNASWGTHIVERWLLCFWKVFTFFFVHCLHLFFDLQNES